MHITHRNLIRKSLKIVYLLVLTSALLLTVVWGQEKQEKKKGKGSRKTTTAIVVVPNSIATPEDPEITISLYPCKGEQPGNVLGISEEAETPQRVAAFIKKLRAPEPKVRACAAKQLGYIGPEAEDAVPHLIGMLRDEKHDGVDINVVDALWEIGPGTRFTVPEYLEKIKEPDVYVRLYAAFSLGFYRPHKSLEKQVIQALIIATGDEDRHIRWMALRGLTRLGPIAVEAVPVLIKILQDKNSPLRHHAAHALGRIGPDAAQAVPALLDALYNSSDNYALHIWAAMALGNIGPVILPLLEQELNTNRALHVIKVLSYLGPRGVPLLIKAAQLPDKEAREEAIEAIPKGGAEAETAIPVLIEALKDKEKKVRQAAAMSLGYLGPMAHKAVPALTAVLKDEDTLVQCWAAEALGRIGPSAKSAVPELLQMMKRQDDDDSTFPQRCAAEGLMIMSPETKSLVPADMVKMITEFNDLIKSPFVEDEETRPKPKVKEKKKPGEVF